MGLKDELLRGVYAYGFERPSAVQQRAVKPITTGRDVIAQSQVIIVCVADQPLFFNFIIFLFDK